EGRRVRKSVGGAPIDFLYDLAGHEITELSSTGVWNRGEVYAGGRHLATYKNSTTYFDHSDWLGTERSRSDISGRPAETCTSLPFGDGLNCSTTDVSPSHFTGKERDTESNLDHFAARYYGSSLGRFVTRDEPFLDQEGSNPQSWNLYTYVRNNPLSSVDEDGNAHSECQLDENGEQTCYTVGDYNGELINNATLQ